MLNLSKGEAKARAEQAKLLTPRRSLTGEVLPPALPAAAAAGLSGFVASLAFGMISDRVGARRLLFVLFMLQAAGFVLFPEMDSAIEFYVLVVSLGFVEYGTGPTTGALIGTIVPAKDRVRVKAIMRTAFNIGFSVGSGIAAFAALQHDFLDVIPLSTAVLMGLQKEASSGNAPGHVRPFHGVAPTAALEPGLDAGVLRAHQHP